MTTIDSFAKGYSPRMPDRGIRRRGALTGHPFPAEDLDAYLKEIIATSSLEVGVNAKHSLGDFTTIPGASVPMATNYGGTGPLLIWVTAAGVVKRLWLSRVASDGATGLTNCYRITAIPYEDRSVFVFWRTNDASTNTVGFSSDFGSTIAVSDNRNWSQIYYDPPTGIFYRIPKTSGTVQGYNSFSNLAANTPTSTSTGVNFDENDRFVPDFPKPTITRRITTALINIYDVSGATVNTSIMTISGGYDFLNMRPVNLNGRLVAKVSGPGSTTHYSFHRPGEDAEVVTPNFIPDPASTPFKVGRLLFDIDDANFGLWYTRDLTTWKFHSSYGNLGAFRSSVGSRLLLSQDLTDHLYFSGPAL